MDLIGTRRPYFIEEDDGLASLVDMEAGISGHHHYPFFSRPLYYSASQRRDVASPRSGRLRNGRYEEPQPHFLEACFLCKKPLGDNRDIFMYRGDTPFCSEECRQEQIDMDEAKEKNWNLSTSMKALRKEQKKSSSSPTKTRNYPYHTGTVAAA